MELSLSKSRKTEDDISKLRENQQQFQTESLKQIIKMKDAQSSLNEVFVGLYTSPCLDTSNMRLKQFKKKKQSGGSEDNHSKGRVCLFYLIDRRSNE
jgi:hypothetical protein